LIGVLGWKLPTYQKSNVRIVIRGQAVTYNPEEIADFCIKIEKIVEQKNVSYTDAVLIFCEETGFEIELVPKLLSSSLKTKIRIEAEDLHYLPRSNTAKLPIGEL
jgi:hypothetical protein